MPIGSVVHYEIEQHLDTALLRLGDQRIEVNQRPVLRIDGFVIGDVVTEIYLWRRKAGRNPYRIHPKLLQIIQVLGNSLQVTGAVVIRIAKAPRIDLVDHRLPPPVGLFGKWIHRHRLRKRQRATQHDQGDPPPTHISM